MAVIKQKQKIRRIAYSAPVLVFLAIFFLFSLHGVWGVYKKAHTAATNKEDAEKELSVLKQREEELSVSVSALKTDRGVEKELRERLGVAKEGEEVVVIIEEDKKAAGQVGQNNEQEDSLWSKIKGFFGF